MEERFALPGAGGIIERIERGEIQVLLQDRINDEFPSETGLWEVPAGKIREYESIYSCLRREIAEETGYRVTQVEGESQATLWEGSGYSVLQYQPFSSAQNIKGCYPIMVQLFLCQVEGEPVRQSNEAENFRWVTVSQLAEALSQMPERFYPLHIHALQKYVRLRKSAVAER